jgi:hypothetical protein
MDRVRAGKGLVDRMWWHAGYLLIILWHCERGRPGVVVRNAASSKTWVDCSTTCVKRLSVNISETQRLAITCKDRYSNSMIVSCWLLSWYLPSLPGFTRLHDDGKI